MLGSSGASVARLTDELTTVIDGGEDGAALGDGLLAAAAVLRDQVALRRAVTDPSTEADAKAGLARSIFGEHLGAAVVDLVASASSARWGSSRDLPEALEQLGVVAIVKGADRAGEADRLEDELFAFGRAVIENPDLRAALSRPGPLGRGQAGTGLHPARRQGRRCQRPAGPGGRQRHPRHRDRDDRRLRPHRGECPRATGRHRPGRSPADQRAEHPAREGPGPGAVPPGAPEHRRRPRPWSAASTWRSATSWSTAASPRGLTTHGGRSRADARSRHDHRFHRQQQREGTGDDGPFDSSRRDS